MKKQDMRCPEFLAVSLPPFLSRGQPWPSIGLLSSQESFYDLQLNVKGCANVLEAVRQYVAVEVLDGPNKYLAEGQGLQAAKKFVQLTALPNVLPAPGLPHGNGARHSFQHTAWEIQAQGTVPHPMSDSLC
jgi:hypothetical protein